jgi:hypothetical protein
MEIWKAIPGFETSYEVSNLGRVKTTKQGEGARAGRILKPAVNLRGYQQYALGRYGGRHTAHLLVMQAFVGPRPDGLDINHLNGIKTDNSLENLEYASKSENGLHATRVLGKRRGESHGNAKINEDDVREIRRLAATGLSQYKIATLFNLTRPNVGYIVRRVAWSHVD